MNRNLVYFSFLLILLGVGSGFYLLSLLGLIALIPALLSPTRPPVRRTPLPPAQAPRRIIPPPPQYPPSAIPAAQQPAMMPALSPQQSYSASYSSSTSALFPMPLLPPMSMMSPTTSVSKESGPATQEGRDELIEVGAILALLKLAFG